MTGNVGGGQRGAGLGFCGGGRESELDKALRQYFTPEFLGRLDSVVFFEPLGSDAMETITRKYLRQLQDRAAGCGIQLLIPEELAAFFGRRCRGKDGARQLRRMIRDEVEGPLASCLLRSSRKPARLKLCIDGEGIRFHP